MGAPPSQRQRWMQRENQRQARRDRDRDRVRQRQDGGHKLRDERRQVMETQHVRDGETQRETQRQRPGSAPTPIHTDRHRGRGPGRAGQPPLPLQARPGQAAPGPGQWALVRAPEEPASWGGLWAGPRRRGGHNSCWVGEGAPPGGPHSLHPQTLLLPWPPFLGSLPTPSLLSLLCLGKGTGIYGAPAVCTQNASSPLLRHPASRLACPRRPLLVPPVPLAPSTEETGND